MKMMVTLCFVTVTALPKPRMLSVSGTAWDQLCPFFPLLLAHSTRLHFPVLSTSVNEMWVEAMCTTSDLASGLLLHSFLCSLFWWLNAEDPGKVSRAPEDELATRGKDGASKIYVKQSMPSPLPQICTELQLHRVGPLNCWSCTS